MQDNRPSYYVLDASGNNRDGESHMMSFYDIPHPAPLDRWFSGHKFKIQPAVPVVVTIMEGYEHHDLPDFSDAVNVMSDAFYGALCDAGVDNLDVYDALLESEDGSVVHKGFKAYNILGLVAAAVLAKTKFRGDSRLLDASIETLEIDPDKATGLLMFRLAENVSTIIVHERVKELLEPMNFPYVQFREMKDFFVP